jgi:hypothetical protein
MPGPGGCRAVRWALLVALAAGLLLLPHAGACAPSTGRDAWMAQGYAHDRVLDAGRVARALEQPGMEPPAAHVVDALDGAAHDAAFHGADLAFDLADQAAEDGSACWP